MLPALLRLRCRRLCAACGGTEQRVSALPPLPARPPAAPARRAVQEGWRIADFFSHHPESMHMVRRVVAGRVLAVLGPVPMLARLQVAHMSAHKPPAGAALTIYPANTQLVEPPPPSPHPNPPNPTFPAPPHLTHFLPPPPPHLTNSTPQFTFLLDDWGVPSDYRHMEGFGVHTFVLVNAEGKETLVKFHWKPTCGGCRAAAAAPAAFPPLRLLCPRRVCGRFGAPGMLAAMRNACMRVEAALVALRAALSCSSSW